MNFKKVYLKNKMLFNFHIFLSFIYWEGAVYSLYAFQSILNIPMIIPFLFLLYVIFVWVLGSHSIFIECIVFIKGEQTEGSIVDYEKKHKKLIPKIRFRKNESYETYTFYREYFDPLEFKSVSVFYYKNWWTVKEMSYLDL